MISIIINAYNAEKHLETTIQSIINQTYSDWELILVDDGSKDDTFRIMKRQSELDSRIRVLKNEKNLGIPRSINLGIDNARGNYIAKIDADDVADSTRLERQIKYLEENPDVDLVGTGGYIINEDGEILNRIKVVKNKCLISRLLRYANPFIHSSIMVKKDALVQVGKYRTGFIHSQDYDLLLRALLQNSQHQNSLRIAS
jgi:glycosyltransferase involved in cell wall biosynthesis